LKEQLAQNGGLPGCSGQNKLF